MTPEQLKEKREEFKAQVGFFLQQVEFYVFDLVQASKTQDANSMSALEKSRTNLVESTIDIIEQAK